MSDKQVKWSDVMKAAHQNGFTDKEYGLVYSKTEIDETIGVEEYAIGERLKRLLERLGLVVEVDIEFNNETFTP